jgi:hypothetical protein
MLSSDKSQSSLHYVAKIMRKLAKYSRDYPLRKIHLRHHLLVLIILSVMTLDAYCASAQSTLETDTSVLQNQLIKEQIESQRAQAAYYKKQIENKSWRDYVIAILTNAAGTLIGAALAFTGVLWANRRQARLEDVKWERSKKDELLKNVRLAAAELSKKIATGAQAMTWLLWVAKYEPASLNERELSSYDREMKSLYSELVGAEVVLAALDKNLYAKLKPLVNDLHKLDQKIAEHVQQLRNVREVPDQFLEAAKHLGDLYPIAYGLSTKIPEVVLESIGRSIVLSE